VDQPKAHGFWYVGSCRSAWLTCLFANGHGACGSLVEISSYK
jgi:hypothetical protein